MIPYGQKTHPALRYLNKLKFFHWDEFLDWTGGWAAEVALLF